MLRADLHVHSTASDGTLTPTEIVELALEKRLDVLAIADHDSVAGLDEALRAAKETTLTIVPALELSAVADGHDVHMLGYFVDHHDPELLVRLADMRQARLHRAEAMVTALRDAGHDVTIDAVLALSDGGAVGRSHVARALVDAGHADDIRDAFERLIGRGRPFYIGKDTRGPAEAIDVIRAAGGVAVVAHPGVSRLDPLIPSMLAEGLGGIEAYHADHSAEQREHYAEMARGAGALATGGSDYHGAAAPNPDLGSVPIPDDALAAFLAWGERSSD
jgi:hypothetical protein